MALASSSSVDIISPAEARFWQEQAQKAPAALREMTATLNRVNADFRPYQVGGVAVGAILGGATFTKYVPGKWKWVSGIGAAASLLVGVLAGKVRSVNDANERYMQYADGLEKDPQLQQQLAQFLSAHVTADDIQRKGIENAVLEQVMMFGEQTPYMQAPGQQRGTIGR